MTLVVVHHHLRPGGVRRVIELATPHLARALKPRITEVVILTGEQPDELWLSNWAAELKPVPLRCVVEPAIAYIAEQRLPLLSIRNRIGRCLDKLLAAPNQAAACWAHNLGLGRNLVLAQELHRACLRHHAVLVAHHHDWWFDNRWQRWPEFERTGFRRVAEVGEVLFPRSPDMRHAAINQADARMLRKHLAGRAAWIPNLAAPGTASGLRSQRLARAWLSQRLNHEGPVWLVPCRFLRRKNIAEALLLARWLRPEAIVATTGSPSSAAEDFNFQRLSEAARRHHWPLRLAVLAGDESSKPSVPELMAASEVILLTSLQEGFGLPYLEAAVAGRPLIARRLPNVAPDLQRFGFRFPQLYEEVQVAPGLFDARAELARQQQLFSSWRKLIPAACRKWVQIPTWFARLEAGQCVPFSRLTLTAQLEVLAHAAGDSWKACSPFNTQLVEWRRRAARRALQITPWPESASRWLAPEAYAANLARLFRRTALRPDNHSPADLQEAFIREKLNAKWLYPILWSYRS